MKDIELTIFTPVYNREKEIITLYNSLLKQSDKRFKWLIIDDGSSDDIEKTVKKLISEADFEIVFKTKTNGGKHTALNLAFGLVDTPLLFCVDSDDYLSPDATKIINEKCPIILKNNLLGLLAPKNNQLQDFKVNKNMWKLVELLSEFNSMVELSIVLNMNIAKGFLLPVVPNEKFMSEETLYNELDNIGYYLFIKDSFYFYEYLEEGITKNINRTWVNNPEGTYLLLKSRYESFKHLTFFKRLYRRIRCTLVYDAFCIKTDINKIFYYNNILLSIVLIPLGYIVYLIKFKRI